MDGFGDSERGVLSVDLLVLADQLIGDLKFKIKIVKKVAPTFNCKYHFVKLLGFESESKLIRFGVHYFTPIIPMMTYC